MLLLSVSYRTELYGVGIILVSSHHNHLLSLEISDTRIISKGNLLVSVKLPRRSAFGNRTNNTLNVLTKKFIITSSAVVLIR